MDLLDGGKLPAAFFAPATSSFADFLGAHAPDLLPGKRAEALVNVTIDALPGLPIVAGIPPNGVVMAGDRCASMANVIAQLYMEKVFQADEYSSVGIAGS